MIAVVTHRVSGSVRTCSSLSQTYGQAAVLALKFKGDLAPGPLHVITNTISVIKKKTGKPSKIWGPATNWRAWAPWPQLQRRTAPAYWPPNSSDLNPVDYTTWGALQQMVYHRQSFVSVDELKRMIVEAWQKLPQSFIDKSVGEWHRRLE